MEKLNLTQQKHTFANKKCCLQHKINTKKPESPAWGLTVIVASMHSIVNFQKFKSPVTLTLTWDQVKVTDVQTDGRTYLSSNLLGHLN